MSRQSYKNKMAGRWNKMAATMASPSGELRPQHSRDNSRDSGIFHTTKGLWNAPGLNNCFLNSAVQVSFHLLLLPIQPSNHTFRCIVMYARFVFFKLVWLAFVLQKGKGNDICKDFPISCTCYLPPWAEIILTIDSVWWKCDVPHHA